MRANLAKWEVTWTWSMNGHLLNTCAKAFDCVTAKDNSGCSNF